MITVTTTDNTYTTDNGKLVGQVRHVFTSPTHWSSICEVVEHHNPHRAGEVTFQYGSGGVNINATDSQVALALSQAFAQAAVLLTKLGA